MDAKIIILITLSLWSFWALYVFGMGIYRAWLMRRLRGLNALLAAPIVGVALLVDAIMQFTVFSIAFAELPPVTRYKLWRWSVPLPELLVTHRLRRYMRSDGGWRTRWADQVCRYLLDPFDPTGAHCDEEPAVRA
jgi:hypothetical protein